MTHWLMIRERNVRWDRGVGDLDVVQKAGLGAFLVGFDRWWSGVEVLVLSGVFRGGPKDLGGGLG
jgi:hypothetical protein